MKKYLLVLFFISTFSTGKSQVVFCPPGAVWHYGFGFLNTFTNEKIEYIKDSIVGQDTLRIISHTREFFRCNDVKPKFTHLKQKGDTVFFRNNATLNTWQILYNFATPAGQSWQITHFRFNSTTPSVYTHTFTVDSVKYVTINNLNLKRLYIGWYHITERIGSNIFMFMFHKYSSCFAETPGGILCYQDDEMGLKQFTNNSCDFQGTVGINEYSANNFKIFPNPASDFLILETDITVETEINFIDAYGREVKHVKISNRDKIDVSDLSRGIYFISASTENEIIYKTKFIKE